MLQKISKVLLVIAWLLFIFILSSIPGEDFGEPIFSWQGSAAHLILYALLAYFLYYAVQSWYQPPARDSNIRIISGILIFSLLYGLSDEYHQSFIHGRYASVGDWLVDGLGSLIGAGIYFLHWQLRKPRILLHICCAGCGVYIARWLEQNYRIVLYYFNPNISPETEYNLRLKEAKNIAKKFDLKIIAEKYNHAAWLEKIRGHEDDKERGERCLICYQERLEQTAQKARQLNIKNFTTTLTVSPHKDAPAILQIGECIGKKYNLKFLSQDFKKQDGYRKSVDLSRQLKLYRQNYCGCEFFR